MKSLASDDWRQHPIHRRSLKIGFALPVLIHAGPLEETESGVMISRDGLVVRQFNRQRKQSVGFARELPSHVIDAQLGYHRLVGVEAGLSKVSEPHVQRSGFLKQISLNKGLPAAPIRVGAAADLDILRVVIQLQDTAIRDGLTPLTLCEYERLSLSRKRASPFSPRLSQGKLNCEKDSLADTIAVRVKIDDGRGKVVEAQAGSISDRQSLD